MPDLTIFEELVASTSPDSYVRVVAARSPRTDRRAQPADALSGLGPVVVPGLVGGTPVVALNERLTSLRAQRRTNR
jgi:hypothetical protein